MNPGSCPFRISPIHWESCPLFADKAQRDLFLTLLPIGWGSAWPFQAGAGASPHLAGVLAALWVASTQHPWQQLKSEVEGAWPAVETLTGSLAHQP